MILNAVEFRSFGQWDKPSLLPEFRYVLCGPEGAEHLVRGWVKILREGLQVSVGEASHARGRVLFVGLDGVEVVIIRGWLGEQIL